MFTIILNRRPIDPMCSSYLLDGSIMLTANFVQEQSGLQKEQVVDEIVDVFVQNLRNELLDKLKELEDA